MDSADRIFFLLDQMKNLDQRQFGYLIGVSPDTVSNWRCHRSKSYTKYLPQIADVLNTTIEYIVSGDRSSPVVAPASREELQAAFWGGEKDLSQEDLDDMWNDVERFAAFLAEKKRQEKKDG